MENVKIYNMDNETSLTVIMLELAEANITGLQIVYEGSGDSGAIENILFTKEPLETPDDISNHIDDRWGLKHGLSESGIEMTKITSLVTNIEDLITSVLLNEIEDWWNNDGGYGVVNMLVPSGQYKIENSVRFMETYDYEHEGDLFNKI